MASLRVAAAPNPLLFLEDAPGLELRLGAERAGPDRAYAWHRLVQVGLPPQGQAASARSLGGRVALRGEPRGAPWAAALGGSLGPAALRPCGPATSTPCPAAGRGHDRPGDRLALGPDGTARFDACGSAPGGATQQQQQPQQRGGSEARPPGGPDGLAGGGGAYLGGRGRRDVGARGRPHQVSRHTGSRSRPPWTLPRRAQRAWRWAGVPATGARRWLVHAASRLLGPSVFHKARCHASNAGRASGPTS